MRRPSPLASPLSFGLTLLLFLGFGISLLTRQGLAFSPGRLTAKSRDGVVLSGYSSHAEFEKQCGMCHRPLQSSLAELCVACHTNVKEQIDGNVSLHGRIANVNQCWTCHPDHRGRDFDPIQASLLVFDHSITDFSLVWHQVDFDATPLECSSCHAQADYSLVEDDACIECHSIPADGFLDAHIRETGDFCLACHDGSDRMRSFDHARTDFPLLGQHLHQDCSACHTSGQLQDTPQRCEQCHSEPSQHQGLFSTTCSDCHTAESWALANLDGQPFNHLNTAGFSLAHHAEDYAGQVVNCLTCHPNDLQTFSIQTCIDCHTQGDSAFMADHQAQFGVACLDCHDGVDHLSNFDHATTFPLEGQHAVADCTGCHLEGATGRIFRGTPRECSQCHAEPELHAGVFGLKCHYCHDANAWTPANLRQHGFPLTHGLEAGSAPLACETCHGLNYIEYTCYYCHDHQPEETAQQHAELQVSAQDLRLCAQCHPLGVVVEEGN